MGGKLQTLVFSENLYKIRAYYWNDAKIWLQWQLLCAGVLFYINQFPFVLIEVLFNTIIEKYPIVNSYFITICHMGPF